MTVATANAFVTGASGFVGTELVKVLRAHGHQVLCLTGSLDAAQRARNVGATPVIGDLLQSGRWQDEAAAADWVFHLLPGLQDGLRITAYRAASISDARVSMDAHLLDAVAAGGTTRIVYVAETSSYGPTGPRPITEDEPPRPSLWGHCFAPAFKRLDGYLAAGLPIVTAFSGWLYGNASWFRERVVVPVMTGRRVMQFGKAGPWVSPIHVHDCARALVHLAERGEVGGRYFLVNSDPIRLDEFAEAFARLAKRPLRVWRMPGGASRLIVNRTMSNALMADAVFSNIRLRGMGFRFRYPTLADGIEQILGEINEQSRL